MASANPTSTTQTVIRVGRRSDPEKVARRAVVHLAAAEVVTVVGGRSTVAVMSQIHNQIVAARPDAVLESVQRHQGATWTFVLPDAAKVTPST